MQPCQKLPADMVIGGSGPNPTAGLCRQRGHRPNAWHCPQFAGGAGPGREFCNLARLGVNAGGLPGNPNNAPQYEVERVSSRAKLRAVTVNLLPIGFVVFMVVGLILLGIATPTESAAFGVL